MEVQVRKVSFLEAWNSTTIFFVDEDLEKGIDDEVEALLEAARDPRVSEASQINPNNVADFLHQQDKALEVILRDIELSEEKFMRIVSLLRKLGHIPGGLQVGEPEWGMTKIKRKLAQDPDFTQTIASLLVDGKRDPNLSSFIPRYYLDTLNYREILGSSQAARRVRYKRSLIGTYGGRKGYKIEARIQEKLENVKIKYGIPYGKGRSRMIDTNIDFAVPGVQDPWVIIMSSFQETTSSGQTTKARDMLSAYERVERSNSRYGEKRAFVNFVDGGGWLARKRDFRRLVDQCHYFINLENLDMLEAIIARHVLPNYRIEDATL